MVYGYLEVVEQKKSRLNTWMDCRVGAFWGICAWQGQWPVHAAQARYDVCISPKDLSR